MKSAALMLLCAVLAPGLAATAPRRGASSIPPAPSEADWRTPDPRNVLVIDTDKGRIIVELSALAAPNTVARVRQLARAGVYDGRSFFRVIDNFMDQTGDPLDSGVGGSSLPNLKPEFTFRRSAQTPFAQVASEGALRQGLVGSLPVTSQPMQLGVFTVDHAVDAWGVFCPGVLGMARGEDPDSANSQFFFTRDNADSTDGGVHALDKKYTAFGRAIVGQQVIDRIKTGEPVAAPQDRMLSVKVLADMPPASRPNIRIIDTASPWFKAEVERERAKAGPGFSVCQVRLPVEVR